MKGLKRETKIELWKIIIPYCFTNILTDLLYFISAVLLSILINNVEDLMFLTQIKKYFIIGLFLLFLPLLISMIVYKIKSFLLITVNQCVNNMFMQFSVKYLNHIEKNTPAEWEYKIERIYPTYLWAYIDFFTYSINLLVLTVIICLMATKIDANSVFIMVFLALLNVLIIKRFSYISNKIKYKKITEDEELQKMEMDTISSLYYLQYIGLKEYFINMHTTKNRSILHKISFKEKLIESLFQLFLNYYGIISKIIVIVIPMFFVDDYTPGIIVMLYYFYDLIVLMVDKSQKIFESKNELKIYRDDIDSLINNDKCSGELTDQDEICIFKAEGLGYAYNKTLFSNLNIEINKGDKILISGKNGSGKSTLLKVLSGQYDNYMGSIKVHESNAKKQLDCISKRFSFAHSTPIIISGNMHENILLGREIDKTICKKYITRFSLSDLTDKKLKSFNLLISGGEAQKISIIRSIVENKHIIFWDEPTNNLDAQSKEQIINILKDPNYTIVFTTHDSSLKEYSNKEIILK